jgi:moderate conductance mechanosensitive channel
MPPILNGLLAFDRERALDHLVEGGGRFLVLLVLALIGLWLVQRLITPVIRVAIREQMTGEPEPEVAKRIETLSDVVYRTFVVVVCLLVVVMMLPEFGINAGPLIAGLGLVGLAVGFGAQHLVRDVINGLEILIENHYGRGDFVRLGTVSGVVEDINLRRTVLRDFDGTVHFVSHGLVEVASNYSRGFSRMNLNVVLPYAARLERVYQIIDEVGRGMMQDPQFGVLLREAPRGAGIDRFGEVSMDLRVEAVTEPGEQWLVARELRRRLKVAFDVEGIVLQTPAAPPQPAPEP